MAVANLLVAEQVVAKYSSVHSFCDRGEIKMKYCRVFLHQRRQWNCRPARFGVAGGGLGWGRRSRCGSLRLLPSSSVLIIILISHCPQSSSPPGQDFGFAGRCEPRGDAGGPGVGLRRRRRRQRMKFCFVSGSPWPVGSAVCMGGNPPHPNLK